MPRTPRQSRSRATVDAIVEAGFLAVARQGTTATTRQIADLAGISIGSLYEYFGNKEAIFEAMHQRFVDDVVHMIAAVQPLLLSLPVEQATRELLHAFERLLLRDEQRYLQVARALINSDSADYAGPVRTMLMTLVSNFIASHPVYAQLQGWPVMAYILIHGGIHLVIDHLSTPNPPISFHDMTEGIVGIVSRFVQAEQGLASGASDEK